VVNVSRIVTLDRSDLVDQVGRIGTPKLDSIIGASSSSWGDSQENPGVLRGSGRYACASAPGFRTLLTQQKESPARSSLITPLYVA
jgi:hypothetical protein